MTKKKFTEIFNDLQSYGGQGHEEIAFFNDKGLLIPKTAAQPNWLFRFIRWIFGVGYKNIEACEKTINFLEQNRQNFFGKIDEVRQWIIQIDQLKVKFIQHSEKKDCVKINNLFKSLISGIENDQKHKVNTLDDEAEIFSNLTFVENETYEESTENKKIISHSNDDKDKTKNQFNEPSDGVNFQYVCLNDSCPSYNKISYSPNGFGPFKDVARSIFLSHCGQCDCSINTMIRSIFFKNVSLDMDVGLGNQGLYSRQKIQTEIGEEGYFYPIDWVYLELNAKQTLGT